MKTFHLLLTSSCILISTFGCAYGAKTGYEAKALQISFDNATAQKAAVDTELINLKTTYSGTLTSTKNILTGLTGKYDAANDKVFKINEYSDWAKAVHQNVEIVRQLTLMNSTSLTMNEGIGDAYAAYKLSRENDLAKLQTAVDSLTKAINAAATAGSLVTSGGTTAIAKPLDDAKLQTHLDAINAAIKKTVSDDLDFLASMAKAITGNGGTIDFSVGGTLTSPDDIQSLAQAFDGVDRTPLAATTTVP